MPYYEFEYNGFLLDSSRGVYVTGFEVKPTRKAAQSDAEGRDGGYIGRAYAGLTTVTLSGLVKGSSDADLTAKWDALLTALKTTEPATLAWTGGRWWDGAQCIGLPSFAPSSDLIAAARFVAVFIAPADETGT